ncbi:hypothetical protein CRENPOLYSF1_670050 [Crenothrix polyspora]|uniref:Uncharacterized protein n=1 Tax=Crenothrix polyspora TaxID=360316 RepID=A0A1R4HGJ7_9GAMM|nr:hypothetical protein CRENPOLYSF1_670050 [Crenothrix polyspora]
MFYSINPTPTYHTTALSVLAVGHTVEEEVSVNDTVQTALSSGVHLHLTLLLLIA